MSRLRRTDRNPSGLPRFPTDRFCPRVAGKGARVAGHRIAHLAHHLPAALAVASLVAIGHLQFHLLDAVDGYAFVAIGNLSALDSANHGDGGATVAVVVIDQQSHEDFYRERSPLDRCELARDLGSLYQLAPKLLVVDLDLSPSLPDAGSAPTVADCESRLDQLIREERDTRTVLMEPFPVRDKAASANAKEWRQKTEDAGVAFGDATLPIRYGLVTEVECEADTLAFVAFDRYSPAERKKNCLERKERDLRVSPRQYRTGLQAISVADLRAAARNEPGSLHAAMSELPVVFFGSAHGDGDTFLTPLGTMYGVEVHAAAYMSLVEPVSEVAHLIGFGLEVALAVFFGVVIAACWRRYYAKRFSSSALERQLSPLLVGLLGLALVALVVVTTLLSLCLLSGTDLWISPIPIATGMLIESFFAGAVTEAVKEGHEQRQALLRRLDKAHREGPTSFRLAVAEAEKQRPHESHSLREGWQRFYIGDVRRLHEKGESGAAMALLLRRLTFIALVGVALCLVLTTH